MQDSAPSVPSGFQPALNFDVLALVADSVICTDEAGRILIFNQAAEQSFGYSASEVIGQPVEVLLPEIHRAEHILQVRNFALEEGATKRLMGHRREVRSRRKNGEEFLAEATVSRQTIDGNTILTVVHRDITERKELEEQREAAASELDHRMRNLLSVVNSLIELSAASAVNVEEFKESLVGRLSSLAATQSALRLGGHQSTSLSELFHAELVQYQTADRSRFSIQGPPVSVGPRAAQILALAVHELATNSAKYGALGSAGGRVTLTLVYEGAGDTDLLIQWQETGGALVNPPARKGFGTHLIEQLVGRALRAEVVMEYRPEGLVCRMTLPRVRLEAAN